MLSDYLSRHHRDCDSRFAEMEAAVQKRDWPGADSAFAAFAQETLQHFRLEEDILFPELETRSPQSLGPTSVMRSEHADMRQLIDELGEAVQKRDRDGITGAADTLLILLQQHNAKEEQILYPLADRLVGSDAALLTARMEEAA